MGSVCVKELSEGCAIFPRDVMCEKLPVYWRSLESYSDTCTKRPTEYCVLHAYRGVNGLRRCSSRVARCLKPKLLSQLVRGGTVGLSPCIVAIRWHIFGLHQRTLRTPMREVRRPYHLLGPQQGSPHLRQDPLGRMPRRLCRRPGQGPTGLRSFRYHAWRGNPSGGGGEGWSAQ